LVRRSAVLCVNRESRDIWFNVAVDVSASDEASE
jgi:hypothetical protein